MTPFLLIVGVVLCVVLSHFFSGAEMSYSSCNRLRLENEKEAGNRKAAVALWIVDRFDDALGAILIGNNLVNIAASSMATTSAFLLAGNENYSALATALVTIAVIIFGETIPKITAKKGANRVAMQDAYPLRGLMILFWLPVRAVVGLVNLILKPFPGEKAEEEPEEKVEELTTLIDTAEDESVIDENESELVKAAIDFPDISASEAMTARVDVIAIDIDDSWEEILSVIERSRYTRIPVYEGSIDHVIGTLHLNRFLKALTENKHPDLRSLLMEPCYVYKTMKLPQVLKTLRKKRQHLAIVVDEYGGTLGIISMEDVLEMVVGDIWDENDTVQNYLVRRNEREYEIDGDTPLSDLQELFRLPDEEFAFESETVGGWTIEMYGAFPEAGNQFRFRDAVVTVLAVDERRVEKILVTFDPQENEKKKEKKPETPPAKRRTEEKNEEKPEAIPAKRKMEEKNEEKPGAAPAK